MSRDPADGPARDPARDLLRFATAACSLGCVLVAASSRGVRVVELGDSEDAVCASFLDRFARHSPVSGGEDIESLARTLAAHVDDPCRELDVALDQPGTPFQREVWAALARIPLGETRSYAEVARDIGRPTGARAVARACATNELAVIVPCHRLVRSDGGLSGYRWGVERKRAILERERAAAFEAAQGRMPVSAR